MDAVYLFLALCLVEGASASHLVPACSYYEFSVNLKVLLNLNIYVLIIIMEQTPLKYGFTVIYKLRMC